MSADGNIDVLALIGVGAAWLVAAVTSHTTLRSRVNAVDERETERHKETREHLAAMERRHTEAMAETDKKFTYIRDRIDKVIDS